jgi:hypothetical protein
MQEYLDMELISIALSNLSLRILNIVSKSSIFLMALTSKQTMFLGYLKLQLVPRNAKLKKEL